MPPATCLKTVTNNVGLSVLSNISTFGLKFVAVPISGPAALPRTIRQHSQGSRAWLLFPGGSSDQRRRFPVELPLYKSADDHIGHHGVVDAVSARPYEARHSQLDLACSRWWYGRVRRLRRAYPSDGTRLGEEIATVRLKKPFPDAQRRSLGTPPKKRISA
jgi:hypothetical protein